MHPRSALFSYGRELCTRSDREAAARLAELGLIEIRERRAVRCAGADRYDASDHACPGVIYVHSEGEEHDDEFRCPACARVVLPSGAEAFTERRAYPIADGFGTFVRDAVATIPSVSVTEAPRGLVRVQSALVVVRIAIADTCVDASAFVPSYDRSAQVLYVVGDEARYAARIPAGAQAFALAALAFDGPAALVRAVSTLFDEATHAGLPAPYAFGSPPPLPLREQAPAASASSGAASEPAFCTAHTHAGKRVLTKREYADLLERQDDFDLFLDTVLPRGGECLGARRTACGAVEQVSLTHERALLVAELVALARPVRAAMLKSIPGSSVASRIRLIEMARKTLDVPLGRTKWRAINTKNTPGGDETTREFVFDPPRGLRYAVLVAHAEPGARTRAQRLVFASFSSFAHGSLALRSAFVGRPLFIALSTAHGARRRTDGDGDEGFDGDGGQGGEGVALPRVQRAAGYRTRGQAARQVQGLRDEGAGDGTGRDDVPPLQGGQRHRVDGSRGVEPARAAIRRRAQQSRIVWNRERQVEAHEARSARSRCTARKRRPSWIFQRCFRV